MPETEWKTSEHDLEVLRRLAGRKREIAEDPLNVERRRLWYKHDAGESERPLMLAESWVAFEDLPQSQHLCEEEWARQLEKDLRFEIFRFEDIQDDHVIEPHAQCNWRVTSSGYGVEVKNEYAERVSGNVSSRRWEPPIKDLDGDFEKLRPRTFEVDRASSLAWKEHMAQVFDGILPVRFRGGFWWTTGMTIVLIDLIGLENMMLYMCTNPDGLHRLMAFLRDDHLAHAEWLEREGLLTLNNENDYIGSGSMGYTDELPQPGWDEGEPVRTRDLWVLSESQETSEVGPAMFEEFVFQYQQPVIERFGRCYYGCCEGVHLKWDVIRRLSNLKRVSISPWCDQARMAEALGRDYVFSRKPNPTLVSTREFSEEAIRADIRETLTAARGCAVELIMKDVHTLCGEPDRLARWVRIAREVIDECW